MSRGSVVDIDPEAWSIENGRLYLNFSKQVRATWNKDRKGYIEKADRHWPEVQEKQLHQ